jgi:hypothetical protein
MDGDVDIIIEKGNPNVTGSRPVQFLLNDGRGFFTDASREFPFPRSVRAFSEVPGAPSFTGGGADIELVDIDMDGDLDVVVANAGQSGALTIIGAMNNVYINRTIGGNANTGFVELVRTHPTLLCEPGEPINFAADPPRGVIGSSLSVEIQGINFMPDTELNFGPDIAVNGITFVSEYRMTVEMTIDPEAEVGPRGIEVENPSEGTSSKAATGTFSVVEPPANKLGTEQWRDYQ